MKVTDFKYPADQRLAKLDALLNQLYGLQIDWESPEDHLESVLANYEGKKAAVVSEGLVALTNPEYGKALLIAEAIRTYLREIAPLRRKKNRRPQQ
jgi:hypothetical protein